MHYNMLFFSFSFVCLNNKQNLAVVVPSDISHRLNFQTKTTIKFGILFLKLCFSIVLHVCVCVEKLQHRLRPQTHRTNYNCCFFLVNLGRALAFLFTTRVMSPFPIRCKIPCLFSSFFLVLITKLLFFKQDVCTFVTMNGFYFKLCTFCICEISPHLTEFSVLWLSSYVKFYFFNPVQIWRCIKL